ncbi:class I SAM-dependent DNA methyltransferase [Enterovibrio norvegicus]|uniref:class I SAM-dependent DNA methyltransferase n=1 Tax=Enterovibrio norvegicus TaxID=188144 RepID=UPI0018E45553|nr:class I SAM-dependent methyltransferase [Enterovibrio norvegicus]
MKSEMYSTHAEQYDLAVQDNLYNAHFERPNLQAMLDNLTGKNVLDLGCGSGVYAQFLLDSGAAEVTCIDASQAMIDIVSRKFSDRVTAYAQDLSQGVPQEASDSKDVIICPLMLHYIEDLTSLFNDAYRVLKSGGYMVFSTHHPFSDFDYSTSGDYFQRESVIDLWNTVGEPVEVHFFRRSLAELLGAVTQSGMLISHVSEGIVGEKIKMLSPETYQSMRRQPPFIFVKCQKM